MPVLIERVMALLDGPRPLPLVFAGDPVLRQPAAPYDFSLPDDLWDELLSAMFETMYAAPGVGLAAPQIGLGIRVAVVEDRADLPPDIATERDRYPTPARVLVNPTYLPGPDGVEFYEGCLSVPGYQAVVRRAITVRLRCQDERGAPVDEEIIGWGARIIAHETDHLDGILYLDRALTRSLSTTVNLLDLWGGGPVSTIRSGLGF